MNLQEARQAIAPYAQGKPKDESPEALWARIAKSALTAEPLNPMTAEANRPNSSQNPQPPVREQQIPMYLPGDASEKIHTYSGKDQPMHVMEMKTRKQIMCDKSREMSAIYRNYALAWVFLFATIALMFFNVYVAAVTAYLAGHFWSEKCVGVAWDIQWMKGKTLLSAA